MKGSTGFLISLKMRTANSSLDHNWPQNDKLKIDNSKISNKLLVQGLTEIKIVPEFVIIEFLTCASVLVVHKLNSVWKVQSQVYNLNSAVLQ